MTEVNMESEAQVRFAHDLDQVLYEIRDLLIEKNSKYGDSALNPVRIFSKANSSEQIKVRIDDKLSRLARGIGDEDEDILKDTIGYLIMLRIANNRSLV